MILKLVGERRVSRINVGFHRQRLLLVTHGVFAVEHLPRQRVNLIAIDAERIAREIKKAISQMRAVRRHKDVQLRMRRRQHAEL